MTKDEFSKQLELYSNAIIGFAVLQGLGFCYQIGSSNHFHNKLEQEAWLPIFLSVLFLFAAIAGGVANHNLGKKLTSLNSEYNKAIKAIYRMKTIVIIVFNLIPFVVTFSFVIRYHFKNWP